MVPAVGAIKPFLIFHILDDVTRMLQGECQFVALHREDTAQPLGCGLRRGREMGGVCHQSEIVHLVLRRHDGKAGVEKHRRPEDALIVFLARLTMVAEHRNHILAIVTLTGQRLQLPHIIGIVEEGVLSVPLVNNPAPRCPAPDGEGGGEEVVVGTVGRHLVDVEA